MSEDFKEKKLIAVIACPHCSEAIEIHREVTYDKKESRHKIKDRYIGEKSTQMQLDLGGSEEEEE